MISTPSAPTGNGNRQAQLLLSGWATMRVLSGRYIWCAHCNRILTVEFVLVKHTQMPGNKGGFVAGRHQQVGRRQLNRGLTQRLPVLLRQVVMMVAEADGAVAELPCQRCILLRLHAVAIVGITSVEVKIGFE